MRSFRILFLFIIIVIYACVEETPESSYKKGLNYYKEAQYKQAVAHFQDALKLNSNYREAYKKLIECYKESNRLDEALDYFNLLRNENPENSYPVYACGVILNLKKQYQNGFESFKKAAKLKPQFAAIYSSLGKTAVNLGDTETADVFLNESFKAEAQNPFVLYGLAYLEKIQMHWDVALTKLNASLSLKPDLADAIILKVKILRDLGKYEQALAVADSGLRIENIDLNIDLRCNFLILKSIIYWYKGENKKVMPCLEEALNLSRETGNITHELQALNIFGLVYRIMDRSQDALSYFKDGLQIARKRKFMGHKGAILSNIGDVYLRLAEYDSSMVYYESALKIMEEIKDILNKAATLGSIAAVYSLQGNYPKAIEIGSEAIAIYEKLGNKSGQGTELINLAAAHVEMGNYSKALSLLNKALSIVREIGEKYNEQICLGVLGETHLVLGDYARAELYFKNARKIALEIESISDVAIITGNLATIYLASGDTSSALNNLNQALQLQKSIFDQRGEAATYSNIASIKAKQGDYENALKFFEIALKTHREIGNKFGQANTLNDLANLFYEQNKYGDAVALHQHALSIGDSLRAKEIIAIASYGLGRTYTMLDKLKKGYRFYKKAIAAVEDIRGQLSKSEYKSSFVENKMDIYKGIVDVLFKLYKKDGGGVFADSALYFAEKGRARSLLDILTEAHIDFKDKKRTQFFSDPISLPEIQEVAKEENALILEYSFGKENGYLWAITENDILFFRLQDVRQINQYIKNYYSMISRPPRAGSLFLQSGSKLYNLLLAPVLNLLQTEKKVIIIPDGNLHYLPFETLITSTGDKRKPEYLIETHQISYAPSSSILYFLFSAKKSDEKEVRDNLIAFANPVFKKSQRKNNAWQGKNQAEEGIYTQRGFDLSALPYSAEEVKNIAGQYSQNQVNLYLGRQASEENVKSAPLQRYSRVHFATHVLIDEELPNRSCIVLSPDKEGKEDGFLRMNEIFNLRLQADLVTLSGCQSGRGKLTRAEGVMGLARAFFYAGAQALAVSLWHVNDRSTARFMESFYHYMHERYAKDAALQKAKLEFIHSEIPKRRHPYFWAPFIITGYAH
jgi:CHAT domain-containing protein/Tfp pilus assembly protein PilF